MDPLENLERINHKGPVELRGAKPESRSIGGYAVVFNKLSDNLGGFVERVAGSALNKSRADGWQGVVCRYNHDDNYLLGATRNQTLRLTPDETGLDYLCDLPESRSDILELVSRGDIGNSSFAFQTFEDDWAVSEQNFPMRTLVSVRLIDVAPVPVPAYTDTTVAMRSLAKHKDVPVDDVLKLRAEQELRKLFMRTDGEPAKRKPMSAMQAKMALLAKRAGDPIGH